MNKYLGNLENVSQAIKNRITGKEDNMDVISNAEVNEMWSDIIDPSPKIKVITTPNTAVKVVERDKFGNDGNVIEDKLTDESGVLVVKGVELDSKYNVYINGVNTIIQTPSNIITTTTLQYTDESVDISNGIQTYPASNLTQVLVKFPANVLTKGTFNNCTITRYADKDISMSSAQYERKTSTYPNGVPLPNAYYYYNGWNYTSIMPGVYQIVMEYSAGRYTEKFELTEDMINYANETNNGVYEFYFTE